MCDSKVHLGTLNLPNKVVRAPLDINVDYADYCLQLAMVGGDGPRALAWLEDRDHRTRVIMMTRMRDGWPQGEALLDAKEQLKMDWYLGPNTPKALGGLLPSSNHTPGSQLGSGGRSVGGGDGGDRPATRPKSIQPSGYCPDHNSGRGCGKQKLCPHGAYHLCSAKMKDGNICGSSHHNATQHGAVMAKSAAPKASPGGGRPKGVKGKKGKFTR